MVLCAWWPAIFLWAFAENAHVGELPPDVTKHELRVLAAELAALGVPDQATLSLIQVAGKRGGKGEAKDSGGRLPATLIVFRARFPINRLVFGCRSFPQVRTKQQAAMRTSGCSKVGHPTGRG